MIKKRIAIVDDHKLFRDGLRLLLQDVPGITVVNESSNGMEILEFARAHPVDLVLMDINMPVLNGIEATKTITREFDGVKVIALSMLGDEEYYYQMLDAGASGFLLKDSDSDELIKAIQLVLSGQNYFSPQLVNSILKDMHSGKKNGVKGQNLIQLSDREAEVLREICKGYSNHEIAGTLFISPRTVERHRANLLSKTSCKNSIGLVMYAIKNGLVQVS